MDPVASAIQIAYLVQSGWHVLQRFRKWKSHLAYLQLEHGSLSHSLGAVCDLIRDQFQDHIKNDYIRELLYEVCMKLEELEKTIQESSGQSSASTGLSRAKFALNPSPSTELRNESYKLDDKLQKILAIFQSK